MTTMLQHACSSFYQGQPQVEYPVAHNNVSFLEQQERSLEGRMRSRSPISDQSGPDSSYESYYGVIPDENNLIFQHSFHSGRNYFPVNGNNANLHSNNILPFAPSYNNLLHQQFFQHNNNEEEDVHNGDGQQKMLLSCEKKSRNTAATPNNYRSKELSPASTTCNNSPKNNTNNDIPTNSNNNRSTNRNRNSKSSMKDLNQDPHHSAAYMQQHQHQQHHHHQHEHQHISRFVSQEYSNERLPFSNYNNNHNYLSNNGYYFNESSYNNHFNYRRHHDSLFFSPPPFNHQRFHADPDKTTNSSATSSYLSSQGYPQPSIEHGSNTFQHDGPYMKSCSNNNSTSSNNNNHMKPSPLLSPNSSMSEAVAAAVAAAVSQQQQRCNNNEEMIGQDCDPRDLEAFAEHFKQRRIKLGATQADVGAALGKLKLPGVGSLSQSTICRFESLTLSHNNMVALKPVLQAWLGEAERAAREARIREEYLNSLGDGTLSEFGDKKRKRTSIAGPEKRSLEAYFAIQPRPSGEKIAQIADKLDLRKNVVRVWFCNQRQKQKRMKFSATSLKASH